MMMKKEAGNQWDLELSLKLQHAVVFAKICKKEQKKPYF